jgi:chemotaxis protein methyltransferase CheR
MSTAVTLDASTFEYVRKLVLDHSAIALEPSKGYLVESRLLPLARELGLNTLSDLAAQLRGRPFGRMHAQVVEAMTTNETSFLRDVHPFEALRNEVLPPLIASRASKRALRIWSAASSSGQEPYTIAMLLREHFPAVRDWDVQIFGSDLSEQMLDRCRKAEYSQLEVNRGMPAQWLVKYFEKAGQIWRLRDEVRKAVRFQKINLIEQWPALPTMDVIFMRNVLIYFTPETKRQILQRTQRQLAPDGTLFLGGAESTFGIDDAWQRVNHGKTSSYRLAVSQ